MGGFLDKPKTEKNTKMFKSNHFRVARSDMQGYREEMEDASILEPNLTTLPGWSFFGVFDGHAGARVAQLAAENILSYILKTSAFERLSNDLKKCGDNPVEQRKLVNERTPDLKRAISEAFLEFDDYVHRNDPEIVKGIDKSGCTAVCAFCTPTHLIIINCGDSRAVFVQDGTVRFATEDHKPSRDIERTRIENADGFVMLDRVNGELAVSRALGDFDYKANTKLKAVEQQVSGEPDVTVLERSTTQAKPNSRNVSELLILACDGVWDVLSNSEASIYFNHRFEALSTIEEVVEETLDACLARGSKDNMTLVLVAFGPESTVKDSPAQLAERELDLKLEKAVRDYLTSQLDEDEPRVELSDVMNRLAFQPMSNLPPAVGFAAKRQKVVTFYEKLSKEMESQLAICRARANSHSESDTLVAESHSDDESEARGENGLH